MTEQILIFSDSEVLIADIEYALREQYDFESSESFIRIKELLALKPVKLVIADMDMTLNDQSSVWEGLREITETGVSVLFMISERKKLEIERDFGNLGSFMKADWLVKPFSRNALLESVKRIFS